MKRSLICAGVCAFGAVTAAFAQNLPYATSYMGNTWGNGAISNYGRWMQNNINGIWVKPDGTVYTASWWDEAGHNGGIYRNGDYVGKLNYNHDYFEGGVGITGDASYVYAGNWNNIYRFNFDGSVSTQVSTTTTATTDKSKSIKGLSVDNANNILFVTQDLDNQVQVWNKSAMTKTRSWSLAGPGACASNGDGTVWVAQPALGKIVHYNSTGTLLGQTITGPAGFDPQALCFDNTGRLVVADNGPDQNLKIYSNLGNTTPTLATTFGAQKGIFSGTPGAVGPLKFSGLTGVGVDSSGNYYIGQNNVGKWAYWNGGGSILESYTSGGTRNWILQGLEFVDCASVDPGSVNGDLLDVYTKYNRYQLNLANTKPGKEATWQGHTLNQFKYPLDQRFQRANDNFDYTGGTFVRTVGGKKILYVLDMQARRLLWYRFNAATDGEIAIPSGLLEQNYGYTQTYPFSPGGGEFIWRDGNGDGQMNSGEYVSGPGTPNVAYGWWVDSNGDIWQCNNYNASVGIRHWKMQGLDASGNPIYSYVAGQYETIARPAATNGDLKRLIYLRDTDTMIISSWNVSADRDAGNRIGRFNNWSTGNRTPVWDVPIPLATAVTAVGDYVFVGYGNLGNNVDSGVIDVYSMADGALVGSIHAGPEVINICGALDIPYGISAYKRANGEYLIFEEDDWHAKVMMFRWQSPKLATDCLDDWTKVFSKTGGMTLDGSNPNAYFDGDTSRATRSSDTTQSMVYKYTGITCFTASVYSGINHADPASLGAVKFYTSPDGTTWTQSSATAINYGSNSGQWVCYNYVPSGTIPSGTNYLKVEMNAGTGQSWDAQVAQITITYAGTSSYAGNWLFNNNANDVLGLHNGTLNGGATFSTDAKEGAYSLSLNGGNANVSTSAMNLGSGFTITGWIKIAAGRTSIQAIAANSAGGYNANGFRFFVNSWGTSDGSLRFETGDGTNNGVAATAAGKVPTGQWIHVAAAVNRAGGTARLYVNGVDQTVSAGALTNFGNNQSMAIGSFTDWSAALGGNIDNYGIHNTVLTAAQIQALAGAGGGSGPVQFTDPLNDWSLLGNGSRTSGTTLDTSNASQYFDGDSSRVTRSSDTIQSVVYGYTAISTFNAKVYSGAGHAHPVAIGATKFYTSPNGTTWTQKAVTIQSQGSNNGVWIYYNYIPSGALPAGTNYVKVEFGPGTGQSWDPQLSAMTLIYQP